MAEGTAGALEGAERLTGSDETFSASEACFSLPGPWEEGSARKSTTVATPSTMTATMASRVIVFCIRLAPMGSCLPRNGQ